MLNQHLGSMGGNQRAQMQNSVPEIKSETSFSIQGSFQGQVFNSYQDVDVTSKGMYGNSLRAFSSKSRGSTVKMFAGDGGGDGGKSPFFDFKIGMLDGSGEKTMKELAGDSKAILLVNVASE